jgi:hypothetical protein
VLRRRNGSAWWIASPHYPQQGSAAVGYLVVELSLRLGESLEDIAVERGTVAADLAEVW